jgi:sialic acid synthase SpsE
MNISGIEIGGSNPCRFVAEISCNHGGSLDRAFRLIEAAKDSGADFCKFQAYTADELVSLRGDGPAPEPWGSQGWTMKSLYQKAATPLGWFGELAGKCADVGIPWFASVFGKESLMEMEAVGCPAYKLASLDREAKWLFDAVKATGKPVIVSRPDHREPRADLSLHCPTGYPQTNTSYDAAFDGFSYHGTNFFVPLKAAVSGASLIECHFHLRDDPSELEGNISLTEIPFRTLVDATRLREADMARA